MRTKIYFLLSFFFVSLFAIAQESKEVQHATLTVRAEYMKKIPSLASQIAKGKFIPAEINNSANEINPKKRGANKAIPGKGYPKGNDPLWNQEDNRVKIQGKEPIITWETLGSSPFTPSDPTGAVGPNHYVNSWNVGFRIWDKEGNPLTDEASLATIFPGETLGDPIVFYDRYADRFVITEFSNSPNGFLVAVCQGSDPVNDGWYTYRFNSGSFPDYPKFSVWSDGYYITANKDQNSASTSEVVFACERDKMLTGDESAQFIGFPLTDIVTSGFYSPLSFNANGTDLPPAGNSPIVYMQDDSWDGVSEDHLKIWNINVDWDTPANSTISSPQDIPTAAFDGLFDGGSFSNLPQANGLDIDALQATIMYMAQYRRFANYNTVVFNFVVDLDGNDDYAGIRWYELRQDNDGDDWTIFQEGTFAQPDGHSAFSGSMAMDVQGNIGLGYTVVSTTQVPSIRYTGRMANDPLGEMTFEEEIIEAGSQDDPSTRYGDYSQLTIDPVDDKTFWHTGEFFASGSRKNVVGAFKFAPNLPNDVGVVSVIAPTDGTLSDSEPVTITVRNFGINEATDIPVIYQVDGGAVISEVATGTIESTGDMQYTFTVNADLSSVGTTYQIMAATQYGPDEDSSNDSIFVSVTHLEPNDLGVSAISSPVSGTDLTGAELITVTITNYGGEPQSDFFVTYVKDGQTAVSEQIAGPLAEVSSMEYTFATTADFAAIGNHELVTFTSLAGDSDNSNDTTMVTITKNLCQPDLNCTLGDGIRLFQLADIDNASDCEEGGFGDFTDLSTNLDVGIVTPLTITTGYGSQFVRVWIDFNDDFVFQLDELVVDNYEIADGQGAGTYTETMDLLVPGDAIAGEHRLRAKTNWNAPVPDDACEATTFGETEEYTVVTGATLDLDVGVFSIDNPNDGSLGASEQITVTVRNFGINEVSDVLVNYQVDGGAIVTEVAAGPIPSSASVQHTFAVTADMSAFGTYNIVATTTMDGDENPDNDGASKDVTNFPPNDIGVVAIVSPVSGESLTDAETLTVTLENFGGIAQFNFDVTFTLDGNSITETVVGPLQELSTMDYTFSATGNFSVIGDYNVSSYTSLPGDFDNSNDTVYAVVNNTFCQPSLNCGAGDGFQLFQLAEIDNPSGCEGYADFTDLSTELIGGVTYDLTVTTGYGNQFVRVWIDFNDNNVFELDEIVVDNVEIADGQAGGSYTETMPLTVPIDALPGSHVLRAKSHWNTPVPDDACDDAGDGETEDYTVVTGPTLDLDVGVFSIDNPNDGALGNAEQITITVRNYGINEVSNVPVRYQIDGGAIVNEIVAGPIASSAIVQHTFAVTADLSAFGTYSITASTDMAGDENPGNDEELKLVTNFPPNDIGVVAIVSPVSGGSLSDAETLTVTIENFGGIAQFNFDVTFTLDGNSVTETVVGPLQELSTMDYTFSATGNLSAIGNYNVSSYTSLVDDFDNSNDTTYAIVTNTMCQPVLNCGVGDGLRLFKVAEIDNPTDCGENGYENYSNLVATLDQGSANELTLSTGYGTQYVRVWIDYNNNFLFELNELVVDNYIIADGQGAGDYTETTSLTVPAGAALGEHMMRAKTNWNSPVPDDACEETTFGETEDYTAVIDLVDAIDDLALIDGDMEISYMPGDQYKVTLSTTNFDKRLIITVHDVTGRKLVHNWVENIGGTYTYDLDMSYAPAGVYLVRMGTDEFGKIKRIVVK